MAIKSFLLTGVLSLFFCSAYSQKGYVVIFGGDFQRNSFYIKNKSNHLIVKHEVEIDHSTSISKNILFLDSTYFNARVKIGMIGTRKKISARLKASQSVKYLYIWYYKESLTIECKDAPLQLE